jgi:hypothetical protein
MRATPTASETMATASDREKRVSRVDSRPGRLSRSLLAALEEENEQLRIALESRIVIEQAKGALSVTHDLSPADAFQLLRRQARSERRNIHTVAAEVVHNRGHFAVPSNGRPPAPNLAASRTARSGLPGTKESVH